MQREDTATRFVLTPAKFTCGKYQFFINSLSAWFFSLPNTKKYCHQFKQLRGQPEMSARAKKISDQLAATESKGLCHQLLVVQKLDGGIQRINRYSLDKFYQNLCSYVVDNIYKELKQSPWRRREWFVYSKIKKTHNFIPFHFAALLVLSTTWNDMFCSFGSLSALDDKFSFFFSSALQSAYSSLSLW